MWQPLRQSDALNHWGKPSNLVPLGQLDLAAPPGEMRAQGNLCLEPLGQNLQLRFSRAVRCLILSDKVVKLGHFTTNNVRRLVRRPSSIPSNTHFRFSHCLIHKDRRESKQPTAFSDKQLANGIRKLLDYAII
nr:hypothetical protein CFP56_47784 [Quercus suber]